MRLGTRLILAFLAVAFIPAGAILTFTWFTVEERFQEEFQNRLDGVSEGIRANLDQIGTRIKHKVAALVDGEQVERILVELVRGSLDRSTMIPQAGKWMKAWDLDLLTILDETGTVLSSGHLPARYGSKDNETLQIVTQKPMAPVIRNVQVLRAGKIEDILAVVVAGKRRFGEAEVVVLGGLLLDEKFVDDLQNLSGAQIQIVDVEDRVMVGPGKDDDSEAEALWVADPQSTYRRIGLLQGSGEESSVFVVAGVSEQELKDAQKRILIASAAAAFAGVLISWLLGLLISRRIIGPVNALVSGARMIAKGELEHRVPESSGGEIGELVQTFNTMVDDLEIYRRKLVRAERVAAWQEIARRIAHEIKNPLSPIQMSIETLRKAYAAGHPDFKEIFEESTRAILEEVATLKRIVSEFSDFARLPKPTMAEQDINTVVEGTVNLYSKQKGGERLKLFLGKDLPLVALDREQISRVTGNLLSNAFWATAAGGSIEVITQRKNDRVVIKVVDCGQGMPTDVLEKVFTPYFTTRRDGTGLGLAIVQRIIEDHGAGIEIDSTEGTGTTITISFPGVHK
ncbi:MAG: HAMP domain-containing protein, partial [Deltaproteobacteria bacterium]|nr:HAMP domain-containing protein [Deltaproteobacteria bacterium]MBW1871407.1 HAMP domain-containing protein [Deltaproteobacteria bacterium]